MSRNASDIAAIVAHRMLRGWVLTDIPCDEPGCNAPLMRSPKESDLEILFCSNCDGASNPPNSKLAASSAQAPQSASSGSHISRISTPPTEVSSAISSSMFTDFVLSEESIRRRQQSDVASAEIGNRLLKGWAMLADECPNGGCYGVPLVRPPKTGSGKDPKKECVVCGSVYINREDGSGLERVVSSEEYASWPTSNNIALPKSNATTSHAIQQPTKDDVARIDEPANSKLPRPEIAMKAAISMAHPAVGPSDSAYMYQTAGSTPATPTTLSALEVSARALETTLCSLSERLNVLSNQGTTVDFSTMGLVAEAMYKVTQALGQVKQLQWSQKQITYS